MVFNSYRSNMVKLKTMRNLASGLMVSTGIITCSCHCGAHKLMRISITSQFKAMFSMFITPICSFFTQVMIDLVFKVRRRSFGQPSSLSARPCIEPSILGLPFFGILDLPKSLQLAFEQNHSVIMYFIAAT